MIDNFETVLQNLTKAHSLIGPRKQLSWLLIRIAGKVDTQRGHATRSSCQAVGKPMSWVLGSMSLVGFRLVKNHDNAVISTDQMHRIQCLHRLRAAHQIPLARQKKMPKASIMQHESALAQLFVQRVRQRRFSFSGRCVFMKTIYTL